MAAALALAGAWVGPAPAGAAADTGEPLVAEALGALSPALVGVRVSGGGYEQAVRAARTAGSGLADAGIRRTSGQERVETLTGLDGVVTQRIEEFAAVEREAAAELAAAQRRLEDVAVTAYMAGGPSRDISVLLDARTTNDFDRRQRILAAVHDDQHDAAEQFRRARDAASTRVSQAVAEREQLRRERRDAEELLAEAQADARRWDGELRRSWAAASEAVADTTVVSVDLPVVVVDAYVRAAERLAATTPSCGIRWSALAGVGQVESKHGTHRGAVVDADGDVAPPIIGIPLDGGNATAVIGDTDGGRFDGDTSFDRAVGPMQFIPSTWRVHGADGNGDGVADPQNLYDAALAAAGYLCRAAPPSGLNSDGALSTAFFSYNHSGPYATGVLGWARSFDARLSLPSG